MRKSFCFLFVIASFSVGCVYDEANRLYSKDTFPPKQIDEVKVLYEAPHESYIVIADFQARNASFEHMRKRAASIGADAVIVVPAGGSYARDEIWADKDRYSNSYTRLIATAIKYNTKHEKE